MTLAATDIAGVIVSCGPPVACEKAVGWAGIVILAVRLCVSVGWEVRGSSPRLLQQRRRLRLRVETLGG